MDNDKSGVKTAQELLKQKKYVFNWDKFLHDYPCSKTVKDINNFIMYNKSGIEYLTHDIILKYFSNNDGEFVKALSELKKKEKEF